MDSCDSRSRSTHNDRYRLGSYFRCLQVRRFLAVNNHKAFTHRYKLFTAYFCGS